MHSKCTPDIDECKEKQACQCNGCTCKNKWGGYDCKCSGNKLYMMEQDTCIGMLAYCIVLAGNFNGVCVTCKGRNLLHWTLSFVLRLTKDMVSLKRLCQWTLKMLRLHLDDDIFFNVISMLKCMNFLLHLRGEHYFGAYVLFQATYT